MSSPELITSASSTIAPLTTTTHTWTIENFNFRMGFYSSDKLMEVLKSATFPEVNDGIQFNLELYPNGNTSSSKGFLSLFLRCLVEPGKRLPVQFKLAFISKKGKQKYTLTAKKVFNNTQATWGWSKFISHGELQQKKGDLMPKNHLVIFCEATFLSNAPGFICKLMPTANPFGADVISDDMYEKIKKHFISINEPTDVTLSLNGLELNAHKSKLSARSPVFADLFKEENTKGKDVKVKFVTASESGMVALWLYIYTGEISDKANLSDLLVAADHYQVKDLKSACEKKLSASLGTMSVVSVGQLMRLADKHNATKLKAACVRFIIDKAKKENNVIAKMGKLNI